MIELLKIPFRKFGPADVYRPWLPVTLINPHANKKQQILGLIDTGADECAFPAEIALILGHNLQSGFKYEERFDKIIVVTCAVLDKGGTHVDNF